MGNFSDNGDVLLQGGPYNNFEYTSVAEEVCIDTVNACTTVTVMDSAGDGMISSFGIGGYYIELDGEEYAFGTGGNFEASDTTRIGNCGATVAPATVPFAPITVVPTTAPPTLLASSKPSTTIQRSGATFSSPTITAPTGQNNTSETTAAPTTGN